MDLQPLPHPQPFSHMSGSPQLPPYSIRGDGCLQNYTTFHLLFWAGSCHHPPTLPSPATYLILLLPTCLFAVLHWTPTMPGRTAHTHAAAHSPPIPVLPHMHPCHISLPFSLVLVLPIPSALPWAGLDSRMNIHAHLPTSSLHLHILSSLLYRPSCKGEGAIFFRHNLTDT